MAQDGGQPDAVVPQRPPGRPRLYEPGPERDLILTAALDVLRRRDGQEVTVAEILREAGLSTRAFYRQFETKEEVIRALYLGDAESFGRHLRRKVDANPDPVTGLDVWVSEALGLAYDRRRSERVAALSSPVVSRVVAGSRERQLGDELLVRPLRLLLEAGLASGVFPKSRPDLDVPTIRALTWEAIAWARTGMVKLSRQEAADHVLRFSLAALGAE